MTEFAATFGLYGRAKVGKTWLASTAIAPMLYLDSEAGGMRFVKRPKRFAEGANDIEIVEGADMTVVEVRRLPEALRLVRKAKKAGYRTVVVDSLSELQTRERIAIQATVNELTFHHWAKIRDLTMELIDYLRDAAASDGLSSVCVLGHKDISEHMAGPLLEGSAADRISYKFDVLGNLSIVRKDGKYTRKLLLAARPSIMAGSRVGDFWPEETYDPNLTELFEQMERETDKYTI